MFKIMKILFLFVALLVISEGLGDVYTKYWLITCTYCSFAFNSCMNCYGENGCKACISFRQPECSACADDIYNKNVLETINGNEYLLCDSMDPIQSKVCHFFCRGQYSQSGQCVVENNLPICKCSSQPGHFTTEQPTTTQPAHIVHFNGTVKLNVSTSNFFQRILPLPNGDLVRGSDSNLIEIWDIEKGVIKRNLSSVYSLPWLFGLFSNGNLVAGYYDNKTLLVWDLKIASGEPLKRVIQTDEDFQCLTVLKNDDLAGHGSNNYDIVIRDSQNGSTKHRLVGHRWNVIQIIEMENGNLVSCSMDRTVKVWDVKSGSILNSIEHKSFVVSIAFLKSGYLASGLHDGTINIWILETKRLIRTLIGHTGAICALNCLHVLNNGDLLSASWDKSLKVWNSSDGTLKFNSNLHKSKVVQLAVLPNGNFVSSSYKELIVWS